MVAKPIKMPTSQKPGTIRVPAKGGTVDVQAEVRAGSNSLTVEEAKELLGWAVAGENQEFKLRDSSGNKILFKNNATNRPFRPGVARRYMSEHLRGKWMLNGETMVIDRKGRIQSAQHRLAGFILAEEERAKDPKHWERRVGKKPLTMPCIIVRGISDDAATVNTIDGGQKRTLGDIFYREDRFAGPPSLGEVPKTNGKPKTGAAATPAVVASDKIRQKLCNILAGAVRLVWIRSGGKTVSDAKHFPITEATEFAEANPKIADAVMLMYNLEGGPGLTGSRISKFITLGYATGLYYLMAASGTDPDEWEQARKDGLESEVVDFKMEKKAQQFWEKFASGAELKADDPIHVLRESLQSMHAGSGQARDEIVGMVIKAFNKWVDGKKITGKDLTIRKAKNKTTGMEELIEQPRLGGIDLEPTERDTSKAGSAGQEDNYDPSQDEREGSKSGKKWSEGDTAWVKGQAGVEHYFCTIEEYVKGEGTPDSVIVRDDQGKQWQEDAKQLSLKYPG